MTVTLLLLVAFAFLWGIHEHATSKLRCGYCGVIAGHDDHCPYAGSGL